MSNWLYAFKSLPYAIMGIIFLISVLIVIFGQFVPKVNGFTEKVFGRLIVSSLVFVLTIFMTINLSKFSTFMKKINTKEELNRKELDLLLKEEKLKNEQLKIEVENLKHAALNVQSFKDISELSLVRTDMKSTIAHHDTIKSPEKTLTKMIGEEFWLVTHYEYEGVKFGVDLEKIRVLEDGNSLYIYGLEGKYIGTETSKSPNNVLCEIRSYESKDDKKINIKVLQDKESEANRLAKKYNDEDGDRIKKGVDNYEFIMNMCYESGKAFIQTFLKPLNMNLEFMKPEDNNENAIPLQEYINQQIESKLNSY